MDDAGLDPASTDELLSEARQLRDRLVRADPSIFNPAFSPAIAENLDQLIQLAEFLLAERAQFQSRLHRRSPAAFEATLDATLPPQWRDDAAR